MLHTHSPELTDAATLSLTSEGGRVSRKLGSLGLPKVGTPVRAMEVCLVTSELSGPSSAGGIGTASVALARQLAADGHRVTILYTQVWDNKPYAGDAPWENWVEQFRRQGLSLSFIPHTGDYADWQAKAWLVMDFLKRTSFDLVYFAEHHGSGYYAISAKRARIAPFVNQTYGVIAHGSLEWVLKHNEQYMAQRSDLLLMGMERRCVEWADFVLSPSEYLLQEYASYGWQLPERSFVHPYPLLRKAAPHVQEKVPVDELVFFGRLEARKGLWLFCEALERMGEQLRGKTVTFMGRIPDTAGVSVGSLLVARAANWPFAARFATWFSTQDALQYLQRPGKLAVIPSLADNSPCVVYECLERGIPFITTLGSGAQELIAEADQGACLVSPAAKPLASKLQEALEQGAHVPRPAFRPEENLRTWTSWHGWLAAQSAPSEATAAAGGKDAADIVTLNVAIDSGACDLEALLENLRQQATTLGGTAGHLVLTSRGKAFQGHLARLLQELLPANTSVLVLGVDEAQQARDIILDSDVAFVSGAEYRIDLAFYLRSAALIRSGTAAAVSCVAAHSDGQDSALQIEARDLPCGDLPGAAAMQVPLGAPVWAIAVAALKEQLESLPIVDETFGQWLSAATLGQRLLQRCQLSQQPYLLLPLVAASRNGARHHEPAQWYRDLTALAHDLGVRTLIHPDAAPWLAMSSQGDPNLHHGRRSMAEQRLERFGAAPDRSHDLPQRLRLLARKIGRPFLAAQLAYANGEQSGLPEDVLPSSCEAQERRRPMDLLWNLVNGSAQSLTGFVRSHPSVAVSPALSLAAVSGQLQCSLAAGRSGTLSFVDLPLQRHERLTCQVSGPADAEVEVTLIDQQSGEIMLQRPLRLAGTKPVELSLRLPQILGTAMLAIELKAVAADTLRLHQIHIV